MTPSIFSRGLCAVLAGLTASGSAWSVTPSQLPLLVKDGSQGKPNVMFTFDDSGSMTWSFLPDALRSSPYSYGLVDPVMHPRDTLAVAYGSRCYVRTDGSSVASRKMRSADFNPLYYNPEVTYTPWSRADGTSFAPSPPTAAWIDPLAQVDPANASTTVTVNLLTAANVTPPQPPAVSDSTGWCQPPNAGQFSSLMFRPSVYYQLNAGASGTGLNDYTLIDLTNNAQVLPLKASTRTDCSSDPLVLRCTLAQERQNFANWFTYYRTRSLSGKGAVSRAFGAQGGNLRVGYGRINKAASVVDGGSSLATVERGVRDFSGNDRQAFFSWLYRIAPSGGTPLRRAMDDVGRYYTRSDNRGPWGNTPGSDDASDHLECRKSYHILMTDGNWNSSAASSAAVRANNDGTPGPTHTSATGETYTYEAVSPYADNYVNTLADVASYYWKNDLRPLLPNRVKPDNANPAFWQNLVQFTVSFGLGGTLDPSLPPGTVPWPLVQQDDPTGVDDLWHAAVNSHGQFLSAGNPDQFAQKLGSILDDIASRQSSEAGVASASTAMKAGNRKYVPLYRTKVWSGDLEAWTLAASGDVDGAMLWSASEKMPAFGARNISVWNGSAAVPFNYATLSGQGLLSDMALTGNAAQNEALVNYLRGDRSKEGSDYRKRSGVLGDIVNSPPTYVKGLVNLQYNFLPAGTAGQSSYEAFVSAKAGRAGMVYVGANDGMLHAFKDGDGVEAFAFVPRAVLPHLSLLAASSYGHRFYVDGPLVETDAYLNGWKNVLIGSAGAGARSVFALDVTDPAMNASKVMWEFNNFNNSNPELGYVLGAPEAGLMANGQWAAVFGNGVGGASGRAQLFIVNLSTGALIQKIDTGVGGDNGLGGVRLIKNAENIVVGAYAGDIKGNMWRFDLAAPSSAQWKAGFVTAGVPKPLVTAKSSAGAVQPIVAAPEYFDHPKGGTLVVFGTGKLQDAADVDDQSGQSLYGIWDKTALGGTSLAGQQVSDLNTLATQSVTGSVTGGNGTTYYSVSSNAVDWATQRGWRMALTQAVGQRVISTPQWVGPSVLFSTMSPVSAVATNPCDASDGQGFNFLLNPLTGGTFVMPVLDTNGDGVVTAADGVVAGYRTIADGRDSVLTGGGNDTDGGDDGQFSLVGSTGGGGGGGGGGGDPGPQRGDFGSAGVQRIWRQLP